MTEPQSKELAELFRVPRRGELVKVTVRTFNGSAPYLDFRSWYGADSDRPGKGVTMRLDSLSGLHAALGAYLARSGASALPSAS